MPIEPLVLDESTGPEIHPADGIAQQRIRTAGGRFKECPVCLGEHCEQIHDASLSVLRWFRGEVTKSFDVVYYE
jgi:hypothetical protein